MADAAPALTDDDSRKPVVDGLMPDHLADRIAAALIRNALIDARRVVVTADGGRVVLGGAMRSRAERHEAERLVRSAPGVTQVENHITVRP